MRRGTTPTHIFKTSIDLTDAEVIFITYRQGKKNVLEKTKDDLDEVTDEKIKVTLSQTDTLAFSVSGQVDIQIRARFPDGAAVASQVIRTDASIILKQGVI